MEKLGSGTSGAKIILVGEHAVVYGVPAIAVPFNGCLTTVEVFKTNEDLTIESRFHNGYLKDGSNTIFGMQQLVYYILDLLEMPKHGLHFKVTSNIEPQRGLGSSAALSVATTRALFNAFNKELSDDELIEHSMYAEKIHHTNPSGLDVLTIVKQKPVWFVRNEGFKVVDINFDGYLLIIDTKMMSQTKLAVEAVLSLKQKNPTLINKAFEEIKEVVVNSKKYLENNNIKELANAMKKNQAALETIGVSNATLEKTIADAYEFGILGAKLTGGGMGGCVIGITEDLKTANNIINNFSLLNINVWLYRLGDLNES